MSELKKAARPVKKTFWSCNKDPIYLIGGTSLLYNDFVCLALNSTTVITLNHEGEEEEEDLVLDFSSGQAEVVENTATQVKVVSEEKVAKAGGKAFTKFRELSKTVGIEKEIEDAGNVTIFSPRNRDFDKLTTGLSMS